MKEIFKCFVHYDGSPFCGWQIQQNEKTVQGEINTALKKICKSDDVSTMGAGRTDAGVHALEQVFRADIPLEIDPGGLLRALNANLSGDIRVTKIERSDPSFHPVRDAQWKEYLYYFDLMENYSPFLRHYVTYFPPKLDIGAMRVGAEKFVGVHDFMNFYNVGTPVSSTTREIFSCELISSSLSSPFLTQEREIFCLRVKGNGFLKQMIRLMVGALVEIGKGRRNSEELLGYFEEKHEEKFGPCAPAQGLYMAKVGYR